MTELQKDSLIKNLITILDETIKDRDLYQEILETSLQEIMEIYAKKTEESPDKQLPKADYKRYEKLMNLIQVKNDRIREK